MHRYQAIQGQVYDSELDVVLHDIPRKWPHLSPQKAQRLAQTVCDSRNAEIRHTSLFRRLMLDNRGVL